MTQRAAIDFKRVEVLTFDCYGTLIDWEAGILAALREALGAAAGAADDEALLELYAVEESAAEARPWMPYREVLATALHGVARALGVEPADEQVGAFATSVGRWPAFADSAASLRRLADRFALGVITNCDDDLFAASNRLLGEPFRWVVTAEQVRSYKPARRNFEHALQQIGRPQDQVVHVAQSLYHDHVPAKAIGLASAWIDRRRGRPGFGATPAAEATPDMACPDMTTFAELALAT